MSSKLGNRGWSRRGALRRRLATGTRKGVTSVPRQVTNDFLKNNKVRRALLRQLGIGWGHCGASVEDGLCALAERTELGNAQFSLKRNNLRLEL